MKNFRATISVFAPIFLQINVEKEIEKRLENKIFKKEYNEAINQLSNQKESSKNEGRIRKTRNIKTKQRQKRMNRQEKKKEKERRRSICENSKWYSAFSSREDEDGNTYYVRTNSAWRAKRKHKRLSNKKIRKKEDLKKGRHCYRVYDYWWEID